MKTALALATLMISTSLPGAQTKIAEQLRKGIVEEDVNRNLDAAVEVYRSILAEFDEVRRTAATAKFRLAECYRKQGKADQAIAAYKQVIQEFPDQAKLVELSRTYLTKTFGLPQGEAAAPTKTQIEEARHRYRLLLEDEIRLIEGQIKRAERLVELGRISAQDEGISKLRRDLLELQRALAAFDAGVIQLPPNPPPRF